MVRQTGKSWLVDVVVNGRRIRRTVASFAEASELEQQLKNPKVEVEDSPRNPIDQPPKPVTIPTMKDMLELTWFRDWVHQKHGEGSLRRATAVLGDMGWLDLTPAEITKKHLQELRDFYQGKGRCNSTVNRKLNAVTKLLSTAFDDELINHKPRVRLLPERNVRERVVTTKEVEDILHWMHALHYVDAWHLARFLIDTGCRVGEAVRLQPQHVFHKSKTALFEDTKNGTSRCIPLTDRALESALKWGKKLNVRLFGYKFRRACAYAGIGADVVPHTLRHTCLTRLAQSGVSMAVLKAWAGHKSMRMTDRYVHLNTSNLEGARDALNDFTDTDEFDASDK